MKFISTRDTTPSHTLNFVEAIFEGLAPNGGLYVPLTTPNLTKTLNSLPIDISFSELASIIIHNLFPTEFSLQESQKICNIAFPFTPKLHNLDDEITLLELFHGPSCAFKDFGASYLATIMQRQLEKENRKIVILVATSGDTGSAVAQAFHKKKNIEIVILYPSKRVSKLQELQLCGLHENIHTCEVLGSFDDCQKMVKEAFADKSFGKEYTLSSANSINIGRLIPQSLYYIYTWNKMKHDNQWLFCTPSGNFGNLTAGLLAMQWGLPLHHFIAATNSNKIIPDYLDTGIYTPQTSLTTLANAMDVGNPSNFERMLHIFSHSVEKMRKVIYSSWASDQNISQEIQSVYKNSQEYICPHTATGTYCSRKFLQSHPKLSTQYKKAVVLATAHAGKFSDIIKNIIGHSPMLPKRLERFLSIEKRSHIIEANTSSLKKFFNSML